MRWRALFLISLAGNLVLLGAWWAAARRGREPAEVAQAQPASNATAQVRTNVLIRRRFFTWSELESPDYATYIANLRSIACPEQTIRDIIIADVNALYARKRATEVVTPDQQWWRVFDDPAVEAAAREKLRALEAERRALLTQLLGPDWETGDQVNLPRPSRPGLALDGPVLGALPNEVKQVVQEIYAQSQDRLEGYLEAQRKAGESPDPAELVRLERQTRNELARVLPPQALEEYLLRYSLTAGRLRDELRELKFFEPSPEEFRALFRARDTYEQEVALLGGGQDAATVARRAELEQQRDQAIRLALGPQRYQQFQRLHDDAYRESVRMAMDLGAPQAAESLWDIQRLVFEERDRIGTNQALSDVQKMVEVKRLELEQWRAVAQVLGEELPPEPPKPPPPTVPHTYRMGESLIGLAARYDVSLSDIIKANPNVDFHRLTPGATIQIPQPAKK